MRKASVISAMVGGALLMGSAMRGFGQSVQTPSGAPVQVAQPEAKPARKAFTREPNRDRSGNDIRRAELLETDTVDHCERMCRLMSACVAFTFVKRSETVPKPICWLKDAVPTAYESSCCTSGALIK